MKRAIRVFTRAMVLTFALVALFVLTAMGQTTTATITGRVVDQQGSVVPGATVTATNKGTGQSRSTVTNSDGDYTLTDLPPGQYDITIEAKGFSKALLQDLELNVGSKQTRNFELKPGQITETVEISSGVVTIETTKSEIGGVVTPVEVQNLPLLNRTFANLSAIMPEARPVGNFDPTKTRIGNVAFNGGDGRQVDVNVDGGDNKDNVVGSLLQNFAYESIQEFQVLQHRWTAESGRAVGGVVNVITKSGTNEFHGSFFANFRDEALRATDFLEKQRQVTNPNFQKPPFSRQEVGGSIGGPIAKDKLFFFFALERFRERQSNALSAIAAANLPLIPGIGPISDTPTPYNDTLLTAKVDHHITSKQLMFYRFSFQKNDSPNDQIVVPANADATNGNTNDNKIYSFVANHTYTFSPTKLNQFSFHFQDFSNEILGITDKINLAFTTAVPPPVTTGKNINVPQATFEKKYQFRDDFSWTAGKHTMKFGTNYIYTKLDGFFFFGSQGYQLTFFDLPSVIRALPQGFATRGIVRSLTFSDGKGDHKQDLHQLAFYFQDDFKITPRLTLNLGLRWDANIGNLVDQTNNRTIKLLKLLNHPRARAITGDDEKLRRTTPSWTEFQPRLGFAWDPKGDGRTIIRGGYGIFYDQLFQNLTLFSLTQTNPELYQSAVNLLQNPNDPMDFLRNFRFGIDPLPTPEAGFTFTELAYGGFGRINDPDATEPYIQKFSIGFETKLGQNTTISSDYVHTLGLHEPRVQVINPLIRNICDPLYPGSTPSSPLCVPPGPPFNGRGAASRLFDRAFIDAGFEMRLINNQRVPRIEQINMIGTTNRSLFDSWTTTLRHRTRRMLLSASYVLASSRSWGGQPVASYSGNGIAITPDNQFKPEEYGPTRLDERHRIVLSGVFDLPYGFQIAPILQLASSRPYSATTGVDIDGDGLATNDRICAGLNPLDVLRQIFNRLPGETPSQASARINARGCQQAKVNSLRSGFIVDSSGNVLEERSGRYFNVDVRVTKTFRFGERFGLSAYADMYNIFNTENLNIGGRLALSPATSTGTFLQPAALYGPGFGPPVGRPFTAQLGFRFTF